MKKLYEKSEVLFSIFWIVIYVVGTSTADSVSKTLGIEKSVTFILLSLLSVFLFIWIKRNNHLNKYGICKTDIPAKKFLYYLPLLFIASCNLWFGIKMNFSLGETLLYVGSMFFVGFLEELIFRGFLFKAMSKDNVRTAIIVSSVTFGIGHVVNLINGSGAELLSNMLQIVYAVAFGFLFVILFYRGKSLLPSILTHSAINMLSAFANEPKTDFMMIGVSIVLTVFAIAYSLVLLKTLPKQEKTIELSTENQ